MASNRRDLKTIIVACGPLIFLCLSFVQISKINKIFLKFFELTGHKNGSPYFRSGVNVIHPSNYNTMNQQEVKQRMLE